ncbi:sugar phosphate isomerase/epimerase family protein [Microlunatus soli]|uniref:Sugar phosphate isomerase/epimerase n=1 Tax=Microlunatus soli TaxID=630515 RepID=A0A1H1YSE3_9ACTN|nr:TIM barrel protein [Microlunatus soli]SDT24280.1 Sugar phosphate isomerase/epimerase [Microlunatus soli]
MAEHRAVSTWSLHRTLGSYSAEPSLEGAALQRRACEPTAGAVPLLELPAQLRDHGYDTVQICQFHLPHRDAGYLGELRSALADADIVLDAVLVDDGDLTHPTLADQHEHWIAGWLETAAELGARRARVIAGQQSPTPERLAQSGDRLRRLAAGQTAVRVVTENWLGLLPSAEPVRAVLDRAGEDVGLLIDLGNWTGPDKYDQLAAIAPSAETCHAKCHSTPNAAADGSGLSVELDAEDYRRSLQVLLDAGFDGPLALIYDGADPDEWTALDAEHAIVSELVAR